MPKIVTLPGDGIGPEVLASALEVLDAVASDLTYEEHVIGGASIDAHGTALTDETLAARPATRPPPAAAPTPSCSPPSAAPSGTPRIPTSRVPSRACSASAAASSS